MRTGENDRFIVQKSIVRNAWRHMSQKGPSNCGSTITRRMMARKSTIGEVLDKSAVDYHNLQIVEFLQKGELIGQEIL